MNACSYCCCSEDFTFKVTQQDNTTTHNHHTTPTTPHHTAPHHTTPHHTTPHHTTPHHTTPHHTTRSCCIKTKRSMCLVIFRGGNPLTFGMGLLMSSNFLRSPNNQTNFFKDPKQPAVQCQKTA